MPPCQALAEPQIVESPVSRENPCLRHREAPALAHNPLPLEAVARVAQKGLARVVEHGNHLRIPAGRTGLAA